uniref:Serpin domain-containing protein n=1 Tax=Salvator merianae TaxID=96440 RepID=A0A8D0BPB9_SALMN
MTTLPVANAKFAVEVFQSLTREHSCENVVFSPVNLTSGFGLLALGSGCEQANVPEYECEKPEGVHTAFSKILATLNEPSVNYTLRFANKLYGDHAIAFIQVSLTLKCNHFEKAMKKIALFSLSGKIKNLLPKGSFDCLAQLLLVNALYFKGQWDVKFDKELTKEAPFYVHYRECHNVQMMNRRGIYNTGTVELCGVQVQILEIPYKDHEISLLILLPTDCSPEALEQLEDGLTHEHLLDWFCDLKPEDIDVSIPKFSLERNLEANHYVNLPELTDHEKADFSGATTTEHVALTQFIHDTSFEIDEEGGEPAEAPRCPRDRRPRRECAKFVANHPFLFFALHHCTQSLLVFGRFSKPE